MTKTLEFWYEFASTYSYPATMRAEQVAARFETRICWQPFLLGPIFRQSGWETSPFNLQPVKGAYMWRDLERICTKLNLPFVKPDLFPQNGLLPARIATALTDQSARAAFSREVYRMQFAIGRDISDPDLMRAVLDNQGLDTDATMQAALSQPIKQVLRDRTELAQGYGIFGAPTWRTSDGEIFWGNDRLEDALSWEAELMGRDT